MSSETVRRIKNLAMERHLTMKALAETCGYTPANLYQVLKGKNPQLTTLQKLSQALDRPISDLLQLWAKD